MNKTWNYIKKNLRGNIVSGLTSTLCWDSDLARNTNNMIMFLNLKDASDDVYDDIPEQTMKVGAEMFFYLNSCPSSRIIFWTKFFYNSLKKSESIHELLFPIAKTVKKIYESEEENALSRAMFGKIVKAFGFQYFQSQITKAGSQSEWSLSKNISHVLDKKLLQRVNNHPVHILDRDGNYSPSAFIPFCSFGEVSKDVGVELEQFDIPVCTSFEPKVFKNQLCYQMDLEKYKGGFHLILSNEITRLGVDMDKPWS